MTTRPPPVPPANRNDNVPEADRIPVPTDTSVRRDRDPNLDQEGRHGNRKQNTTHQGYQQSR